MHENDVSTYQLFYVEAIMNDSSFPQLNRIRPIFETMNLDDFLEIVGRVFESDDPEAVQQFLYFLLLFRDMPHIQGFINNPAFSISQLERLVVFIYGYCTQYDHSTERVIDEILSFIDEERLLDLVLNSAYIAHDKLFLFLILSRFDTAHLNRFIATVKKPDDFVKSFIRLPDEILKALVARNYHLFQYIMILMGELNIVDDGARDFVKRFKTDIEHFSRLSDTVRRYRNAGKSDSGNVEIDGREMGRISFLVNMVKEFPDPESAITYFYGEKVFQNEFEMKVVKAIITDPILKNSFNSFDSLFTVG